MRLATTTLLLLSLCSSGFFKSLILLPLLVPAHTLGVLAIGLLMIIVFLDHGYTTLRL
jgi:hypothetical protein